MTQHIPKQSKQPSFDFLSWTSSSEPWGGGYLFEPPCLASLLLLGLSRNKALWLSLVHPLRLPSTLMFDHPTTKAIAAFAAEQLADVVQVPTGAQAIRRSDRRVPGVLFWARSDWGDELGDFWLVQAIGFSCFLIEKLPGTSVPRGRELVMV